MPSMGVTVAVLDGETILLTKREDFEVWCMPGGVLDEGEGLAEAARREVREETGLEVELTRLVGAYSQVGRIADHDIVFAARIVGGVLTPDPHEVLEARFFPFDALPEHLLVSVGEMLRDVIQGKCGVVKTEQTAFTPDLPLQRADLYAARDQSIMERRAYYQHHFPELTPEQIITEVAGTMPQEN